MGENVHKKVENPVLHVLVVGFHHKKGCQVEYSFPPLVAGSSSDDCECPAGWKYLPTLALPDGSHNYDADTVFFHLPSLTDPNRSVFGISCFRQIPVEKLKNRTADITRGTVQKSVCVLSRVPLYGHIEVKMALITHAYFDEGDFTKVTLLSDTYHHLNACLGSGMGGDDTASQQRLFVGLSARDLLLQWRHKALLLFKLLLLERKVVFYMSPVRPLCATILSLLSLHPGMIETGLYQSACIQPSRPMSPMPQFEQSQRKTTNNAQDSVVDSAADDSKQRSKTIANDVAATGENIDRINNETVRQQQNDEVGHKSNVEEGNRDRLGVAGGKEEEEKEEFRPRVNLLQGEECSSSSVQEDDCNDRVAIGDLSLDEAAARVAIAADNNSLLNSTSDSAAFDVTAVVKRPKVVSRTVVDDVKTDQLTHNGHVHIAAVASKIEVEEEKVVSAKRQLKDTAVVAKGQVITEVAREVMSDESIVSYQKAASRKRSDDSGEGTEEAVDDYEDDGDHVTIASLPRDASVETLLGDFTTAQNNMALIAQIDASTCAVPLPIFTEGYLCMPYLSLPYLDLLSDVNVRGYVVGATNVLFKQKKQLADVIVEVESGRIETSDVELRRELHLSTEDLRFADYLVRHVVPPDHPQQRHDVFLDGVGWEGGDEWLRAQFRGYLLSLLRTSLLNDGSRELDHFNAAFVSAWRRTHSYSAWLANSNNDGIWQLNPGHPFAGQLSVADMRLRISHTMQNTEGGRKLNQAMVSTGRAVATTGRAVGGALSQAKGALTNWWSNLTTAQSPTDPSLPQSQPTENGQHLSDTEDGPVAVESTKPNVSSILEV